MKIRHVLIILVLLLISAGHSGATEIMNIRNWTAPDHTRVVIDVDSEPVYDFGENKNLLVLNFKNASLSKSLPAEIILNTLGIKKLILNQIAEGNVKIEFVLDKYQKAQVFKLKKFQNKPDRIVVDIYQEQISKEDAVAVRDEAVKAMPKKIIIIDPGHGGDDPGAVGKNGTYEKNIVLLIGREIKKAVNKIPGYRAHLTREGDYYVSFNKRLQMAKDLNASLFISVHADAARNRKARGSSIYCLSTGAASNEAAKLLAKNENLSDIIGGVPNGEGKSDSDQIILNMFQTNTINLSKTYAGNLMNQLNKVNTLKYKSVQEAPFRVLKLPDIPAVLIEMAYISNAEEERLLKSSNFQKKLALAVASSVTEYLSGTASIVQGSDVLSGSDKRGPANVKDIKGSSRIYIVKKGDTLFSLAKNNSLTIDELCKLNNRKNSDPLLMGQKIRLP